MSLNIVVPRSLSSHCPFTPVKSRVYYTESAESLQSGRKQAGALWLDSVIATLLSQHNISSSQCLIVSLLIFQPCSSQLKVMKPRPLGCSSFSSRNQTRSRWACAQIKNWLTLYHSCFSVKCRFWVCHCWSTYIGPVLNSMSNIRAWAFILSLTWKNSVTKLSQLFHFQPWKQLSCSR